MEWVGIDNDISKQAHDSYAVYVNNDYIGNKTLLVQSEKIDDVKSFLKTQGFTDYNTQIDGGQYKISCDDSESRHMKEALNIYLHNR